MREAQLIECAKTYGTPLYVYDFEQIKSRFKDFKNAFRGRKSLICYALKANSNLSIISYLAKLGAGADCVSIGEVRRALRAGIPNYKVIFSGVGKRDDEIEEALKSSILFLNVESYEELLRVEQIAISISTQARISIRVNPNIDANTHPYISTGLHENKFGVDIEQAKKMFIYAKKSAYIEPIGIHFHIGSQLFDIEPIIQCARKIAEFAHVLLALQIELKFFDVGGGLGICYTNEKEIIICDYAQGILDAMRGLDMTIICEPGRYIVGKSGVLISKVLYEKQNERKRFVIIDAAMNDLMRPALYGAIHRVKILQSHTARNGVEFTFSSVKKHKVDTDSKGEETLIERADIVGAICESSDFLAKDVVIEKLSHDDLLAFENAGAYGYSMSNTYNSRPRAAEVGIMGEEVFLIRARETFDDLLKEELKAFQDFTKRYDLWK